MNLFRRVYAPKCINVVPLQATDSLGSDMCGQCCYIIGQHLGLCVPGWPSLRPPPPPEKNGVIDGLLGDTNILCCSAFPSFAPHPLVHIGALPFDVTNHANGGGGFIILSLLSESIALPSCAGLQGYRDRTDGQGKHRQAMQNLSLARTFGFALSGGGGEGALTDRSICHPVLCCS